MAAMGAQILRSPANAGDQSSLLGEFVRGSPAACCAKIILQRNADQLRRGLSLGAGAIPEASSKISWNADCNALRNHMSDIIARLSDTTNRYPILRARPLLALSQVDGAISGAYGHEVAAAVHLSANFVLSHFVRARFAGGGTQDW